MKIFQILLFLVFILSVSSCSVSSIEDFVVGKNFITDETGVALIDSLTLKSSTVLFDSVISNSPSRFLVGSNYNAFSGYKSFNTFLEMKFDDEIDHTEDVVYDSLNLILYYDTYYFGDTTVNQSFTVHQIQEKMELDDDNVLYTISNFDYDKEPLGSITLSPRPKSHKKVSIRLSDSLGKRFLNMIVNENDTITSEDLFTNKFFYGLVVKATEDIKGAAVGFRISDATTIRSNAKEIEVKPEIRLYYHLSPNPDMLTDLYYKFSFYSDGIYFNQVSGNQSNSLIDGISDSKNELSSDQTNEQILIQAGVQIFSKIRVPYLDRLYYLSESPGFIAATMRLYPVRGTYKASELPDSLYVYSGNKKNQLTSQIYLPGSSSVAYAFLGTADDAENTKYYEFDVSSFISSELETDIQTENSLMIGFGLSITKKTATHLILGGQNSGKYAPELNVYYYHN